MLLQGKCIQKLTSEENSFQKSYNNKTLQLHYHTDTLILNISNTQCYFIFDHIAMHNVAPSSHPIARSYPILALQRIKSLKQCSI